MRLKGKGARRSLGRRSAKTDSSSHVGSPIRGSLTSLERELDFTTTAMG